MTAAFFSVGVDLDRPHDLAPRWVVSCDRCGADLSSDYVASPLVVRVGDDVPPERRDQIARSVRLLLGDPNNPRHRLVVVDSSIAFESMPGANLQRVLEDHARSCGGRS